MEFKKKLIIYSSMLGGLMALFALGTIVNLASAAPQGEKIFSALKTDEVAKVVIADKNGRLNLEKDDTGWKIITGAKTFKAAKDATESLLSDFADMRKKSTAGAGQATWASFSVDEASAVRITLSNSAGVTLADCYFGKGGSTSFSQYVRLPAGDEVIQIDTRIEKTTVLKEWVERRLFPDFLVDDVARVTVKTSIVFSDNAQPIQQALSYTLVQGEKDKDGQATWQIRENDKLPLATSAVNGFVSGLSRFTADNVVEAPETLKLDLEKPLGSVVIALKSGVSYTLFLIARAETETDTYYVTNQDRTYTYTAGNYALKDAFRQGVDAFIDAQALLNPQGKK